jgi:DNA-directed RNA polymerase specialized sigma24 family protein
MHAAPEVFERFGGVIPILGYLKRCVKSVFIDQARKAQRDKKIETALECGWAQASSPEKVVLDKIISDQFAQEVYAQLDEQESLVFKLTFELDLTPRQIVEQSPHLFSDIRDIYRIKERAFRRLRSNPMLKFLYDDL